MEPKTNIEQLLFGTVRIEADKPTGTESGTAFIFSYEHDKKTFLFLITNKHVVTDSTSGRFFFTLSDGKNPKIGERFDVRLDKFKDLWFAPENAWALKHQSGPLFLMVLHFEVECGSIKFDNFPISAIVDLKEQESQLLHKVFSV